MVSTGVNAAVPADATYRMNFGLLLVVGAISAAQYGALPLVAPVTPAGALILLVVIGVTTPLHWGLVHESFHGVLARSAATNRRLGRGLAILIGMAWDSVRFGHLSHHDSNRHLLDRPEVLPNGRSWSRAAPGYYAKLLGGHAFLSALSELLAWLPLSQTMRMIDRISGATELKKFNASALKSFTNRERRARIRVDSMMALLLIAAGLWAWGRLWPVFAATYVVRYAVLSLLDNAHHYGTALDSGADARNTWLPGWARGMVLNQNFHGIHHARPELRWRELADAFAATGGRYQGTWYGCVLRQFRGPMPPGALTPVSGGR